MDKINFEAMQIRIEFLYRLTCSIFTVEAANGISEGRLSALAIDDLTSIVATEGCALIYKHRRDDGFNLSHEEYAKGRAIGSVIVTAFNNISMQIRRECTGLPITLTMGKQELIVREGIAELMDYLKKKLTEMEVSNG